MGRAKVRERERREGEAKGMREGEGMGGERMREREEGRLGEGRWRREGEGIGQRGGRVRRGQAEHTSNSARKEHKGSNTCSKSGDNSGFIDDFLHNKNKKTKSFPEASLPRTTTK